MTPTRTIEALGVEVLDQKSARDISGGIPLGIFLGPTVLYEALKCLIEGFKEGYNAPPM